ncbi:MAG TPA: peptidase C39 [Chromatiales bacterium]|nr:peptidase C39 [Chromatiales bacterium]
MLPLLPILVLIATTAPTFASDIHLSGVVPGAGVVYKNVVSMRERRFMNMVRQHTDYSCGAAALATILKYGYHMDMDEKKVLDGMYKVSDKATVEKKGFSMLNMKRYLQQLGLRGRGYKVPADKLDRIRMPVIALLDINGYNHFVVFRRSHKDRVYVADPALGNRVMDRQDFLDSWNGVIFAVISKDFDKGSILLDPDDPLYVNKAHMLREMTRKVSVEHGHMQVRQFFNCIMCF